MNSELLSYWKQRRNDLIYTYMHRYGDSEDAWLFSSNPQRDYFRQLDNITNKYIINAINNRIIELGGSNIYDMDLDLESLK